MNKRPIVISTIYTQEESGAAFYRLNMPNAWMEDSSDLFEFRNFAGFDKIGDTNIVETDLFVITRVMDTKSIESVQEAAKALKQFGARVILDLDDYWVLNKDHVSYKHYKDNNLSRIIEENIRQADYITCSTDYLASRAGNINTEVTVIKNVPYPNKFHQYVPIQKPAPYVRFGWFGGAQHIEDVALMEKSMKMLCNDKSLNGKYTVTLGGYNDNPSYNFYERIFSNRGNNKHYNRIPARSVYEYMYGYNDVDVAYAPVNKTEFNRSRSELKVVEAGWMGKALICSDMDYYKEHIKHGYNGFIVSKAEESGWYRYTKQLILDKDLREGMQKNLQEYVLKNFQFPEIFAKKANLYLRAYRENGMENRIQNLIDNGTISITEPGATAEPTEGSTEA